MFNDCGFLCCCFLLLKCIATGAVLGSLFICLYVCVYACASLHTFTHVYVCVFYECICTCAMQVCVVVYTFYGMVCVFRRGGVWGK